MAARSPGFHSGKLRLPEYPSRDELHDVEGCADDCVVLAQRIGFGDRHIGVLQGRDHLVLAVDGVGRGQQLARGLAPQGV